MYRKFADALVLSSDAISLLFNLFSDIIEVGKTLVEVKELAPLSVGSRRRGIRVGDGGMDELKN